MRASAPQGRLCFAIPDTRPHGTTDGGAGRTVFRQRQPDRRCLLRHGAADTRIDCRGGTSLGNRRLRYRCGAGRSVRPSCNGFSARSARATDPCCSCRTVLSTSSGRKPCRKRCDAFLSATGHPCRSRSHARTAVRRSLFWNEYSLFRCRAVFQSKIIRRHPVRVCLRIILCACGISSRQRIGGAVYPAALLFRDFFRSFTRYLVSSAL